MAARPLAARVGETKGGAMEALVYHGPGQRAWELVPDPKIEEPTDAVVRIDKVSPSSMRAFMTFV